MLSVTNGSVMPRCRNSDRQWRRSDARDPGGRGLRDRLPDQAHSDRGQGHHAVHPDAHHGAWGRGHSPRHAQRSGHHHQGEVLLRLLRHRQGVQQVSFSLVLLSLTCLVCASTKPDETKGPALFSIFSLF